MIDWRSQILGAMAWTEANAKPPNQSRRDVVATAIRYASGDMLDDVESELDLRYPGTQRGSDYGQEIIPLVVPLVRAYLAELATIYSGPVLRRLISESGETDSEATEVLNRVLDEIGYDQTMHAIERIATLLPGAGCGAHYQVALGELSVVPVHPQDITPVEPDGGVDDPGDQRQYDGFVVDRHKDTKDGKRTYAAITAGGMLGYSARDPLKPEGMIEETPSPLMWPAPTFGADGRATGEATQPLHPIVLWHAEKPTGSLISLVEPSMVTGSRVLSVLWSFLFDLVRFQGGAMPVISSMHPTGEQSKHVVGVRHPLSLTAGDTASLVSAANDYAGISSVYQQLTKILGMCNSLAPGDLSIDESAVTSGIAKIVESMPKTRAQKKAIKWYSTTEARLAWPRIGSILVWLRILPESATKLRLVTELRGERLPVSIDDRIKEDAHDLELGHTSPAKILADRAGMTLEAAEAMIDSNRVIEPDAGPAPLEVGKVQAILEIVTQASAGTVPVATAAKLVSLAAGIPPDQAAELLSDIEAKPVIEATEPGIAPPEAPPPPEKPPEKTGAKALLAALANGGIDAQEDEDKT